MAFLGGIIGDALGAGVGGGIGDLLGGGAGGGIIGDVLGALGGGGSSDGIGSLLSDIGNLFGSGLGTDSVQPSNAQGQSSGSSTLGDIASIAATVLPLLL